MIDLLFRGRRVVFDSLHGVTEAQARLAREVAAPEWSMRRDRRTQLFEGTVADGRFEVVRRVQGRNSFRPMIEGQLSPSAGGSRIEVRMRMSPAVLGLLVILLGVGALVASVAASDLMARNETVTATLVVLSVPALAFAMLGLASMEARKAARLLAGVFDAKQPPAG
jgi:hypothetical protein